MKWNHRVTEVSKIRKIYSRPSRYYIIPELVHDLGISRATLYRALKICDIKKRHDVYKACHKATFISSMDLWKLKNAPFFKSYIKKIKQMEADGLFRAEDEFQKRIGETKITFF
jgi:hypothetical protein